MAGSSHQMMKHLASRRAMISSPTVIVSSAPMSKPALLVLTQTRRHSSTAAVLPATITTFVSSSKSTSTPTLTLTASKSIKTTLQELAQSSGAPWINPKFARVLSRTYATEASPSSASAKPPIMLFNVDGTYASALYSAAVKSSALQSTARAMEIIRHELARDTKLQRLISSPFLSLEDKQQVVVVIGAFVKKHPTSKSGTGIATSNGGEIFENFLSTLAANNRLSLLQAITHKFEQLVSASQGQIELVITSTTGLDAKTLKTLETAVQQSDYISEGQKIKMVTKINPDIKGGLIVEIGERIIDLSVAARLSRLNHALNRQL